MLNTTCIDDIKAHAESCYPEESCGFIVQNMSGYHYIPCVNIADNPSISFTIAPSDYLRAANTGKISLVVHSHPDGPQGPSEYDRLACSKSGLPWLVISYPNLSLSTIYPTEEERPYKGRTFMFGIQDCYSLIQDYYKKELNIALFDYYREDEFWLKGKNYYIDRFTEQGFEIVTDAPREHDLFLMTLKADIPNHGAIYLGDSKILHHVAGRLSSENLYSNYWQKITRYVIRHKSLL